MTKISTAYLKWALITIIFVMAGNFSAFSQEKLSKKQRKKQEKEALASRLFVEGQKFLMLEEYDRAYFYFEKALSYNPDEAAIYILKWPKYSLEPTNLTKPFLWRTKRFPWTRQTNITSS